MAEKVDGVAKGAQDKVQGATSGIFSTIEGWGNWIVGKGKEMLDRVFPPETRAAFLAKLQAFMLKNPKLSTFLGMNLFITGVPLFLFVLFSLTVFIFALVVGLLLGLLGAVAFTLFCVGLALTIVLPTIFFTTMGATFLFLWGLGGYYLLKWANGEGSGESGSQDNSGPTIGDRLNSLTGGRLTGFMQSARSEEAKKSMSGWGDENTPAKTDEKPKGNQTDGQKNSKPQANGSASPLKTASDAANTTTNTAKKATNATGGAQKAVGSTAGTVTGGLSGVAGTS